MVYILIALLFYSCKKYPENNLWFKSPKKIIEGVWYLESYKVNGTDSVTFDNFKMFKEKGIRFSASNGIYNYEQFVGGTWSLIDKKKKVFLKLVRQSPVLSGYQYSSQRNIFIEEQGLDWKIEKLCENSFWISVINNNINYEIHFSN